MVVAPDVQLLHLSIPGTSKMFYPFVIIYHNPPYMYVYIIEFTSCAIGLIISVRTEG